MTIDHVPVVSLEEEIRRELEKNPACEVHLGTDSQQREKFTRFVSVVVMRRPGTGARAFYRKWKVDRIVSLRERLMRETLATIELANRLVTGNDRSIPESVPLSLHIDVNVDEEFQSSRYLRELVGMVMGQGFSVVVKPDSWASSRVADRVVKYITYEDR